MSVLDLLQTGVIRAELLGYFVLIDGALMMTAELVTYSYNELYVCMCVSVSASVWWCELEAQCSTGCCSLPGVHTP